MALRRASDPEVKAATEALLGEESNPGGKARKGESSDEDDATLAENLVARAIRNAIRANRFARIIRN